MENAARLTNQMGMERRLMPTASDGSGINAAGKQEQAPPLFLPKWLKSSICAHDERQRSTLWQRSTFPSPKSLNVTA